MVPWQMKTTTSCALYRKSKTMMLIVVKVMGNICKRVHELKEPITLDDIQGVYALVFVWLW